MSTKLVRKIASSETRNVKKANGYGSIASPRRAFRTIQATNQIKWIKRNEELPANADTRSLNLSSALRFELDSASISAIICTLRRTVEAGRGHIKARRLPRLFSRPEE